MRRVRGNVALAVLVCVMSCCCVQQQVAVITITGNCIHSSIAIKISDLNLLCTVFALFLFFETHHVNLNAIEWPACSRHMTL